MRVLDWGRRAYPEAHADMRATLEARVRDEVEDTLILVEHDPVFTLGRRRGAEQNVHDAGDAPVIPVERGGDVTFHGPGQVVAYPICRLPPGRQDLHAWLRGLEDVAIGVLATWGVVGGRDPRNTGVWVDGRKIAAIGVACRSWVTWHGLAINVATDLSWFRRINPCGLGPDLTTRLQDLVDPCPSWQDVADRTAEVFSTWWEGWVAPG